MPFWIVRKDKSGMNEPWQLDFANGLLTLTTPRDGVLVEWSPTEAARAVELPSFLHSVKYTGFNVADHGIYRFGMDSVSLTALRAFVNRGIAAGGSRAIRARLRRAILESVAGFAMACGGIVLTYVTFQEVTTGQSMTNGDSHPAGVVTAIVGVALLCHGIYGIWNFVQLQKLQQAEADFPVARKHTP